MRSFLFGLLQRALLPFLLTHLLLGSNSQPARQEILEAMKRASDFMMNQVSYRGGFVWHYSADLSQRWGELPSRQSQIWVQPPGTPTVGAMFLDAYKATGDAAYLRYAERVASALIWGQHASGG